MSGRNKYTSFEFRSPWDLKHYQHRICSTRSLTRQEDQPLSTFFEYTEANIDRMKIGASSKQNNFFFYIESARQQQKGLTIFCSPIVLVPGFLLLVVLAWEGKGTHSKYCLMRRWLVLAGAMLRVSFSIRSL